MFLIASLVTFVVFFTNVAMGAFARAAFLSDLQEMLVLALASVLFVIGILKKEAARRNADGG